MLRLTAIALLLAGVVVGLGPGDLVRARGGHVSHGSGCAGVVALTFDDGPNPPSTGEIVDILARESAHATFFVEGEAVRAHPEALRALREAGMAIGLHSYSHTEDTAGMSADGFRRDLESAAAAVEDVLGYVSPIYRAPFGRISATMVGELRTAGYTSIGWDIDSTDWRETSPEQIVARVLSEAHPGAIVLLHDGGLSGGNVDRSGTIAALPSVIRGLRERGYELVTVPELLGPSICSASPR